MPTIEALERTGDARALASIREQMSKMVMDWLLGGAFNEWLDLAEKAVANAEPTSVSSSGEIAEFDLASDINRTIAERRPTDDTLWSKLNGFVLDNMLDTGWIARQIIDLHGRVKAGVE